MFIGEILANMTQVSDVAPGPLVSLYFLSAPKLVKMLILIFAKFYEDYFVLNK